MKICCCVLQVNIDMSDSKAGRIELLSTDIDIDKISREQISEKADANLTDHNAADISLHADTLLHLTEAFSDVPGPAGLEQNLVVNLTSTDTTQIMDVEKEADVSTPTAHCNLMDNFSSHVPNNINKFVIPGEGVYIGSNTALEQPGRITMLALRKINEKTHLSLENKDVLAVNNCYVLLNDDQLANLVNSKDNICQLFNGKDAVVNQPAMLLAGDIEGRQGSMLTIVGHDQVVAPDIHKYKSTTTGK